MKQAHHHLITLPEPADSSTFFKGLGFKELYPPLLPETHFLTDGHLHLQLTTNKAWRSGIMFLTEQPLDSLAAELQLKGWQTILQDTKIRLIAPDGTAIFWMHTADYEFPAEATEAAETLSGRFYELSLEVEELEENRLFWESLGFKKIMPEGDKSTWLTLSNGQLHLGLYLKGTCKHPFTSPALTFFNQNAAERLQAVQKQGYSSLHVLPTENGSQAAEAVLETPGQHHLFLFQAW